EPDAVLGPEDVVVHRLGDADDRHPLLVEAAGEGEGAVAADRDEGLQAEELEGAEGRGREVHHAALVGRARSGAQVVRDGPRWHDRRVDPRGVEDGAAAAVDGPRRGAGERQDPGRVVGVVEGEDVEEGRPAAAEAHDLVAGVLHPAGEGLDRRAQPGDDAAAGEDAHASDHRECGTAYALAGAVPRATRRSMRSTTRFEQPHSLSYQAMTLTKPSPTDWVG